MSYAVVNAFEQAISIYTGAKGVVATNSCSSALLIALDWQRFKLGTRAGIAIPSRTYCSVPNAITQAGFDVEFLDIEWKGEYPLHPFNIWDSARRFTAGMFRPGQIQCVSFQTSKILGLEQGGAVLHDDPEADEWLRRQRFDGRLDASEKLPKQVGRHCYMNPSTAALGLQRLACLPKHNPDNGGSEMFEDLSNLGIW